VSRQLTAKDAKDAKDAKEGISCAFFTNRILKPTLLLTR
jgi:hypothetical protein